MTLKRKEKVLKMSRNNKIDDSFAKIWWKSRAEGKKSQEYMAYSVGVSKKTIQNWENGKSSPDLFQSAKWFEALGLNPIAYYLEYLYPDMYRNLKNSKGSKELDSILIELLKAIDDNEKANLVFILLGKHGGSVAGILEMMNCFCHLGLFERSVIAESIVNSFKLREATDALVCKDDKMPVFEILDTAIKSAKVSLIEGKEGYTIQNNK